MHKMGAGASADIDGNLSELAKELLTESGYLSAMAVIYEQLVSGECTRDQTSGLIGARRCLESFAEARQARVAAVNHAELVRELQAAKEAMRQQGSGATNFSSDQVSLPRRPSAGAPPQ